MLEFNVICVLLVVCLMVIMLVGVIWVMFLLVVCCLINDVNVDSDIICLNVFKLKLL